ncbi:hypothetical protein OCT51_05490 [Halomonas sp. LR3S48]|uniref:hypothetical protein n=1 Tax=Halomonas sp. LR3S48 TaxID=2982694 RepID=UPI0021E3F5FD|nr:hypothetical protein [Halomonas sp. LR3S48]UYG04815.1 hypothetical protein OCT51_05490 [Halomonas sp. LR3S48]
MTPPRIARMILATSAGLLMSGLTIGAQAQFDPQGLYSSRAILDADVHFESAPDSDPSEVVDMLMGDDKKVHAIVVRSNDAVGQNGDTLVITDTHYRLVNHEEDGETRHDIIVEADQETLETMPRYDREWWDTARQRTREAWDSAGEGADSAWERTRQGLDRIGEGAESAWERTQEGAERTSRRISETLEVWSGDRDN